MSIVKRHSTVCLSEHLLPGAPIQCFSTDIHLFQSSIRCCSLFVQCLCCSRADLWYLGKSALQLLSRTAWPSGLRKHSLCLSRVFPLLNLRIPLHDCVGSSCPQGRRVWSS